MLSRSLLLTMGNISDKTCTEKKNTLYVQKIIFFSKSAVYEIIWKNVVEPDRPQMTI
jgi:hypothetical protein